MAQMGVLPLLWMIFVTLCATTPAPQKPGTADALMGAGLHQEDVTGNLNAAIQIYRKILADPTASRAIAASAQLHIGICLARLSNPGARQAFEAVQLNYPDQQEYAREARKRLAALAVIVQKPIAQAGPMIRQIVLGEDILDVGSPSPDGHCLAYLGPNKNDLSIFDLSAGTSRHIMSMDPSAFPPTEIVWAPKGDLLIYTVFDNTKKVDDLWIVNPATRTSQRLPNNPQGDFRLGLLNIGGESILVLDQRTCSFSLVSLKDGSIKHIKPLICPDYEGVGRFAISPDGRYVAYDVQKKGRKDLDINLTTVDENEEVSIVGHGSDDRLFGWAPDGKELYVRDLERGSENLLSIEEGAGVMYDDRGPSWMPDGRRVVFRSTRAGNWDIYIKDASAGSSSPSTWCLRSGSGRS